MSGRGGREGGRRGGGERGNLIKTKRVHAAVNNYGGYVYDVEKYTLHLSSCGMYIMITQSLSPWVVGMYTMITQSLSPWVVGMYIMITQSLPPTVWVVGNTCTEPSY